jgi:transcription initiation factor TFIIIB Brf1 subunit/transcription initiation factor TFIIB
MKRGRGVRKCQLCHRAENQFVYDSRTADWICTICGCVVRGYFFDQQYDANYEEYQTAAVDKDYFSRQDKKRQKTTMERIMDRANPEDVKERRFHAMLEDICVKLEYSARVKGRAEAMFNRFKELKKQRKMYNVIAAVLIVAKRSLGEYVNLNKVQNQLTVKLNSTIKDVLNITGISQSSLTVKAIPYYIFSLGLPFKEEKRLRKLFEKASRSNSSMGSDTLLALCIFRLLKHLKNNKHDLQEIANLTNTSYNSLQSYISGKNKCTLFN